MKFVILDRDGVINEDSDNFIKSSAEFKPLPGSLGAIARLKKNQYTVVIATNQSGIARSLFDIATLNDIHLKLRTELKKFGVEIDDIFYCPHGPDDDCACRKPKPGLFNQIKQKFGIELTDVPCIGDSLRDIQAAEAVGAQPILVKTGKGRRTIANGKGLECVKIYADLGEFVDKLLQNKIN